MGLTYCGRTQGLALPGPGSQGPDLAHGLSSLTHRNLGAATAETWASP